MARTVNDSRYPAHLPRNWRVMTATGVAALGLACGLAQPALAEWWKLTKSAPKPAAATDANNRTAPAENGFAGTIRRLMEESRRAAEQGDRAKAIKLAERAAKISEAAAQVVGPAADCSPQETSRFLAEMRLHNNAPAAMAAGSLPQTPTVTRQAVDRAPANVIHADAAGESPAQFPTPLPTSPVSRVAVGPPLPAALQPRPNQAPPPRSPQPQHVVQSAMPSDAALNPDATGDDATISLPSPLPPSPPSLSAAAQQSQQTPSQQAPSPPPSPTQSASQSPSPFPSTSVAAQGPTPIARPASIPRLQHYPSVGKPAAVGVTKSQVPPSPSSSTPTASPSPALADTSDLLAQSRLAAADGDLDRAIELAERAIRASRGPSLFGPVMKNSSADEATRWRNKLMTEKFTTQRVQKQEQDGEVFEPPIKVTTRPKRPAVVPAAQGFPDMPHGEPAKPYGDTTRTEASPYETQAEESLETQTLAEQTTHRKAPPAFPADTDIATDRRLRETGDVGAEPKTAAIDRQAPAGSTTQPIPSTTPNPLMTTPIPAATVSNPADDPLWTEPLPPSPAPHSRRQREPVKFSRSVISRSGGWVNADDDEATGSETDSRASGNSSASAESLPATNAPAPDERQQHIQTAASEDTVETIPEFPIGDVPDENVLLTDKSVDSSLPANLPGRDADNTAAAGDHGIKTASAAVSDPASGRSPLRLRGAIQQVAAEFPFDNPQSDSPPKADATIESADEAPPRKADSQTREHELEWSGESTDGKAGTDRPVQRFPIQRVIQLRKRLETAASLNPGGWNAESSQSQSFTPAPTEPFQNSRAIEPPLERAVKRDVKPAEPTAAGSANAEWQQLDRSIENDRSVEHGDANGGWRAPIKLRGRSRLQLDDTASIGAQRASTVPKSPGPPRQPSFGHSEPALWKSVDPLEAETESGRKFIIAADSPDIGTDHSTADRRSVDSASQPGLVPPISQVGFESTTSLIPPDIAVLGGDVSAGTERSEVAPPPPTSADDAPWYPVDPARRTPSVPDAVTHKSSFAMIDQLAETCRLPVSTVISLVCGGGLALIAGSLIALRVALRRRHS